MKKAVLSFVNFAIYVGKGNACF